ncbi:MAG: SCO family protein [Rhodanobacteraceae bacterium]|nr:MAG: SCO family protein [Rhodanobacteraceae bacterium]
MSVHRFTLRWLMLAAAVFALAACTAHPQWQLDDVSGHMPDLKFQLTNDLGQPVTAANYRGKIVMLYFGYTHCPDVCPLTLVHLHTVLQRLGKQAADRIQVLFVTVDPARDTVPVLHQYVTAFDPRFVGLRGDSNALDSLVKRYRAIYEIQKPIPANGDYEVTHSSAIYIFGPQGRIRLLATPGSTVDEMVHDLDILLRQTS